MTQFLLKLNLWMLALLVMVVGAPVLVLSTSATISWDQNWIGLVIFLATVFICVNVMGLLLWNYLRMIRRR